MKPPRLSAFSASELARLIDYAVLQPIATSTDVLSACELALELELANVTTKPCHVALASERVRGSSTVVGTVVGFPHGAHLTRVKALEAQLAVEQGATELDMVCNIGAVKAAEWALVARDIAAVVSAAGGALVKVILETALLSDFEKARVCELSVEAGARFVKTSTGYAATGATVEDVRLLRSVVGQDVGVKASGGIRALAQVLAMLDAGANRIGTSSPAAILGQLPRD